jgi:CheY-like chemotaxis protein
MLVKPAAPGTLLDAVQCLRQGLSPDVPSVTGSIAGRKRVVVVDDSPDVHDIFRDVLESEGFTVVSAYNGKEALELLVDQAVPGLLIIDLVMPEMNGMQLIEILQSYRRLANVPMMIVSAVTVPEPAQLPNVRYFVKPFDDEALLDAVRELTLTAASA